MAGFTKKKHRQIRKTKKIRRNLKKKTRKNANIQFGGGAEQDKVVELMKTIVEKLKSKNKQVYEKTVYEKEVYELFESIMFLLSQTDQVSQDMHKQMLLINSNNISDDEDVNKLLVFMSQLLSRRLEPGYVKKQLSKDLLTNVESIFTKYKTLCDCVEQSKPCNVEELANSMNEIYEPRATIKKNIEKLATSVKDNYDDIKIYITVSGFVKFYRTLDEWRKMIKDDMKITKIVELLKPIVDKYSFLVPRVFLTMQLKELSETDFNILFAKKTEKEPESKKVKSKKPESKEPEKEVESKEPEKEVVSNEPEKEVVSNEPEPKPKEGGIKVEDTPQIDYVKGMPSEKRQKKLEERERQNMEKEEIIEKSLLKMELEAKKQASKQQASKQMAEKLEATMQVAVKNYIFAEIDPINKKIKKYSDEIKEMLKSIKQTDATFDILTAIDIEKLYVSIQRDFGAFAQREDGKFKYMFNYEPDIEQSPIKYEYRKAQCMLLFTIGYLNDILSKSGVDYAKYILKGGGAMKLRLAEILEGEQIQPIFFSNDIDVKSYLNPTKFADVNDPNFLIIYQFGLGLVISKIFHELIIHDLMMLKFFPERSILKLPISFLEPDVQPLASKMMRSGSKTPVFKISLDSGMGKIIPIADIDPSPPSEIGIPTTQDTIVDEFASQELVFYVDNFGDFIDDKIKYYQVYYDTYLKNPYDNYVSKTFRKFSKYINLFIQLMQIRPALFNEQQKKDLKKIEKQKKDLEKIEEQQRQIAMQQQMAMQYQMAMQQQMAMQYPQYYPPPSPYPQYYMFQPPKPGGGPGP